MTNQGGVQQAVRDITGTALDYNGDWSALFDLDGIPSGDWNGRLLAWINQTLGTSYTNLPGAMQAFAVEQGFNNWSSMNTFTVSEAAAMLADETNGLALSFTDDAFLSSTGHYGSARVKDTGTPANNYNSHPFGLLNYGGPPVKWVRGPTGLWFPSNPANDLPFEWDESGNLLGIRIEEQRQSRALRSRRLDDETFWTATNITPSAVEGVDGVTGSATRITATDDGGTILGSMNTASSGARRLAPFIRRASGTGDLEWTLDGGSTWTAFEEEITSSFKRIGVGATVANPRIGFRIASSGDSFDIDFANGEDGAFDTSPIESTDSHVTRAADNISLAASKFPWSDDAGTFVADFQVRHHRFSARIIGLVSFQTPLSTESATQVASFNNADPEQQLVTSGVSNMVGRITKVASAYTSSGRSISADGGSPVSGGSIGFSTPTTVWLGSRGGQNEIAEIYLRRLIYVPREMTTQERQAITS